MRFSVKWLRNHQLRITHGRVVRCEGPEGTVSRREAAKALGTYYEMIARMVRAGRIAASNGRIPMSEVLRLRRAWKATGRPTAYVSETRRVRV